ncbi:MAG TPA: hypothetical protein VFX92_04280 [Candidatus Krumholzibacteria bacterium]|nr:hypothetical protein [Candidatus Krumholzibacteria bacterium]
MLRDALRNTRYRWWFGRPRARRKLRRAARGAFRPGGTFCIAAEKQLNKLPAVLRVCAAGIRKSGHRQLCTFDADKFLVAVPRGIVQNDYRVMVIQSLVELPQVRGFAGLTERVLTATTREAECMLFERVAKGRQIVDETGRGIIMDVDRDFRWRLNGVDGHYYYAATLESTLDLTGNRERRRFIAALKDLFHGQTVHLKRMRSEEISETTEGFRLRQTIEAAGARSHTTTVRIRKTRETEETVLTETTC